MLLNVISELLLYLVYEKWANIELNCSAEITEPKGYDSESNKEEEIMNFWVEMYRAEALKLDLWWQLIKTVEQLELYKTD